MSSSNENIATVSENTGGNRCPSTLEGCREIKVSCLRAGTATITAKNTDNKQATMSVEVSEEIIPVTITYSLEDGVTCSNDTKTVNSGTKWGALCTPTKKGYKFDGWYTEETGGTKVTKDTVARGDITVYARWSIAKNPETGLFVPITLLLLLLGSSVIIFIILTKRTKQFNQ